jgi:uncharacterized protein (TIGR04255 family)
MTFVMTRPVIARELAPLPRAPLKLALVQARTAPTLALEQTETVASLVEVLGWELVDRQSNVELSVRLGPGGIEQQGGPPQTVWVLAGPGGQFRAVLSQSSVAVECGAYSQWADFRAGLVAVLGAVAEVAAPGRVNRFGVRYVNELTDERLSGEDPGALTQVLAEELVSVAAALETPVISSLSELRVREPFGQLAIRHGMTAPGRYLLDFDAYNETTSPFDVERLMEAADAFHARIEALFAWCLQPDYLEYLAEPAEEVSE